MIKKGMPIELEDTLFHNDVCHSQGGLGIHKIVWTQGDDARGKQNEVSQV